MKELDFLAFATEAFSFLDTVSLSDYYGPRSSTDDVIGSICERVMQTSPEQQAEIISSLSEGQRKILARYGLRCPMLALRERSPGRLLTGLIAYALVHRRVPDWRDDLVALAPAHYTVTALGVRPSDLFEHAATFASPDLADVYRTFGQRTDVTLRAFGWRLVEAEGGPTFEVLEFGRSAPTGAVIGERSWDEVHQRQVEELMRWIQSSKGQQPETPETP
jgi:hypothetical protein